jgi:hypothetical protein
MPKQAEREYPGNHDVGTRAVRAALERSSARAEFDDMAENIREHDSAISEGDALVSMAALIDLVAKR